MNAISSNNTESKVLILVGFASVGKTVTGRALADRLGWEFRDLDREIESSFAAKHGDRLSCRQIFRRDGEAAFRQLEQKVLLEMGFDNDTILATGGGTITKAENCRILSGLGKIIYLRITPEVLFCRMTEKGLPAFMDDDPTLRNLQTIYAVRAPIFEQLSDFELDTSDITVARSVELLEDMVSV